jgi:hypothetical protein
LPPTSTNVSIDPIIDAGHRAKCGYRRGDEAATRDSENARPRYAYSSHRGPTTAFRDDGQRCNALPPAHPAYAMPTHGVTCVGALVFPTGGEERDAAAMGVRLVSMLLRVSPLVSAGVLERAAQTGAAMSRLPEERDGGRWAGESRAEAEATLMASWPRMR